MPIICLGLNHKTAPVEIREAFALSPSGTGKALSALKEAPGISEVVVLSTCNRVECYAVVEQSAEGWEILRHALFEKPLAANHLYRLEDREGVAHLYRVVSGLDSMVLGETEINGQVKQAYEEARREGCTSGILNRLFQKSFHVAKMVRSNSAITRGPVSVGAAAVELAARIFGALERTKVMILGAGETGERTARSLQSRGVKHIVVANRSLEKAHAIAAEMGGRAVSFDEWEKEFEAVDILISSTSAPHPVVHKTQVHELMRKRRERPVFIIDIAVPRDVEPEVNEVEGVYLYDIDSLQEIAREGMEDRRREAARCEEWITTEAAQFHDWLERPHRANSHHPSVPHPALPTPERSS